MATEWYLLKKPHNQFSGYEDEIIDDYARDAFDEALDSSMAVNVELCNYDLSNCKKMRAIVQNNVQDTKLKTLSRHMFVPIGSCKAGMYVKYKNRYWLIVGLVDDNKMYEKAVMIICNYLLTWINRKGDIVQRWANIASASQYNNGETGIKFYTVRSDQLMVLTANDEEVLLLDTGARFIIDKRCPIYEKSFDNNSIIKDTSNPVITYSLTRTDNVLCDYQDSGYGEFMVTQEEQCRDTDGYYIVNGKGYWLCKEPNIDANSNSGTSLSLCKIEYDSNEIYDGLEPSKFTAKFYDENGNITTVVPTWDFNCSFKDKLNITYTDDSVLISANNSELINKSFELTLKADKYKASTITITIRAFF